MTRESFERKLMAGMAKGDKREMALAEIRAFVAAEPDENVYILGANITADFITRLLRESCGARHIRYLVDDAYLDRRSHIPRSGIIGMNEYLSGDHASQPLVIGFANYVASLDSVNTLKDRVSHIYYINYVWVNKQPVIWTTAFIQNNIGLFYETYCMFEDEYSRETMIEYLIAAVTGELKGLFEWTCGNQYFNDLLNGCDIRSLVDCGAYDGDTVHTFVQSFGDYRQIWAFEPDSVNVGQMRRRIEREGIRNIAIVDAGAHCEDGVLYFAGQRDNDRSGCFVDDGDEADRINVRAVDSVVGGERVDLIKMDIEGSEMDALRGARQTIARCKPALAICVYHKTEDIITIPQYIRSIVVDGDYRFYLRHHGEDLTELVFYAIPISGAR